MHVLFTYDYEEEQFYSAYNVKFNIIILPIIAFSCL